MLGPRSLPWVVVFTLGVLVIVLVISVLGYLGARAFFPDAPAFVALVLLAVLVTKIDFDSALPRQRHLSTLAFFAAAVR